MRSWGWKSPSSTPNPLHLVLEGKWLFQGLLALGHQSSHWWNLSHVLSSALSSWHISSFSPCSCPVRLGLSPEDKDTELQGGQGLIRCCRARTGQSWSGGPGRGLNHCARSTLTGCSPPLPRSHPGNHLGGGLGKRQSSFPGGRRSEWGGGGHLLAVIGEQGAHRMGN